MLNTIINGKGLSLSLISVFIMSHFMSYHCTRWKCNLKSVFSVYFYVFCFLEYVGETRANKNSLCLTYPKQVASCKSFSSIDWFIVQ